jgi:aldehyde:ferredoxin oxidoreductase
MSCGYHNKILRVDLTAGKVEVEQPGEHFFRAYFGSWGLIAHCLLQELEPGTDPLGLDNLLILSPGHHQGMLSEHASRQFRHPVHPTLHGESGDVQE